MKRIYLYTLVMLGFSSCAKTWLDVKPDTTLVVPEQIEDFQALLDNVSLFNGQNAGSLLETSADNYYMTEAVYNSLSSQSLKNIYIWAKTDDLYAGAGESNWRAPYEKLLAANIVLEGIEGVKEGRNTAAWNNVKGSGLFFRAYNHYLLAAVFCDIYDAQAANKPGIPLKTNMNVNQIMQRGTLKQSYDYIIADLELAAKLLPMQPANKMRPSRMAAWALLVRVYLSMSEYEKAWNYARLFLDQTPELLDYNKIDTAAAFPFDRFNSEVIFSAYAGIPSILSQTNHIVDSVLYDSYDDNDLRKPAFFTIKSGFLRFKGSYFGTANAFGGLASDEVYVSGAECLIRLNQVDEGVELLNELLSNRWRTGTYQPFTGLDKASALRLVLDERRKSLVFRNIRLTDIKRINRMDDEKITLRRKLGAREWILPPNDVRYILPIPANELLYNPIEQNSR